jgi:hypothetical protein
MALINWALVEQRRVDVGLTIRRLCDRSGISERALHGFDAPSARDDWITMGQLKRLALVVDLPASALLGPGDQRQECQSALDYYEKIGHRPATPLTRFAGTAELDRAESQHARSDDASTLLAALHLIGSAVDRGALANALDWSVARFAAAREDLAGRLAGTGLRLHCDEEGRWSLASEHGALTSGQRTELRNLCVEESDAAELALLWTLFCRGPVRQDQLEPVYRALIAGLEQRHLIERRGRRYAVTAVVSETLATLTA